MTCGFVENEKIVFRWKNGRREPAVFLYHDEKWPGWARVRMKGYKADAMVRLEWLERRRP